MFATIRFVPQCDCPKGNDLLTVTDDQRLTLWCPLCKKYWEIVIVYHGVNAKPPDKKEKE